MTYQAPAAASTRTLSDTDFATAIGDRYFEDYTAGAVYEYGHITVTEAQIVEFAQRFDPQPIHTDPGFAATGPFGGLIASGWHTAGILMRLFADHYLSRVASLASPGVDELRWPAPVRPGDALRLRTTTVQARPSRSKPDRGIVHTKAELINQGDQVVLHLVAMNLLLRRQARDGS
ncbi:MAG: MaoC family dehydratase [Micromonosporaceae bacterium]